MIILFSSIIIKCLFFLLTVKSAVWPDFLSKVILRLFRVYNGYIMKS